MGRLKRLKKIRIHREGTHTLMGSFLLLFFINAVLYWGLESKVPFYVVAVVSLVVYGIMVNFFRCPIRLFGHDTTKVVVAPADGKVVVVEEVEENEPPHHDIHLYEPDQRACQLVPRGWHGEEGDASER